MRVAVVAPNDLRIYDGTTARITGLTKYLSNYLPEVLLVSKTINRELMETKNIRHIKVNYLRPLTQLFMNLLYIAPYRCLSSLLIESLMLERRFISDIDVIHAHWVLSLPVALSLRRFLSRDVSIIVDLHGLFELQATREGLVAKALHRLFRLIERIEIYDEIVKIFTVPSEAFKEYLVNKFEIPKDKVCVIPDGIDVRTIPFFDENTVLEMRRSLKLENRHVIGYVGTPDFYHGIYDLVTAFKILRKKCEDCLLLLIVPSKRVIWDILKGSGLEEGDVRLIENAPRQELYRYLSIVDVFILPHRAGTQFDYLPSNKLLDYMAVGGPIVAYSLKSVQNMLKNYPLKVLVEPNKPERLAEGIITALRDYKGERVGGRVYVEPYDWANVAKTAIKCYSLAS